MRAASREDVVSLMARGLTRFLGIFRPGFDHPVSWTIARKVDGLRNIRLGESDLKERINEIFDLFLVELNVSPALKSVIEEFQELIIGHITIEFSKVRDHEENKVWFRLGPDVLILWADGSWYYETPPLDGLRVENTLEILLEAYPASDLSLEGDRIRFEHDHDNVYNMTARITGYRKDGFSLDCGFPLKLNLRKNLESEQFNIEHVKIIKFAERRDAFKIKVEEPILDEFISGTILLEGTFPTDNYDSYEYFFMRKARGKIASLRECYIRKGNEPKSRVFEEVNEVDEYRPSMMSDSSVLIELQVHNYLGQIFPLPRKKKGEPLQYEKSAKDTKEELIEGSVNGIKEIEGKKIEDNYTLVTIGYDENMKALQVLCEIGRDTGVHPFIAAMKGKDDKTVIKAYYAIARMGEEAVEPLIHELHDKDASVRARAASLLGQIQSKKSIDELIDALHDEFFNVRRDAASALGNIGDEKAVRSLTDALNDTDPVVKKTVVIALGRIGGEKAVRSLTDALNDTDPVVKTNVAIALGRIGGETVVEPLSKALKDKNYEVRQKAVESLGMTGSEKAEVLLLGALNDRNKKVRASAIETLGMIKSEKAIRSTISLIKNRKAGWVAGADALVNVGEKAVEPLIAELKSDSMNVRYEVADVLGRIGSKNAIEPLIVILKDENHNVRYEAAVALGKIGSRTTIGPLSVTSNDEHYFVRKKSAEALCRILSEKAVEPLMEALKDKNESVRGAAATALGNIGSEKAVGSLIEALQDKNAYVRREAALALGKIRSEEAIEGLIQILKDENVLVGGGAARALGMIGNVRALSFLEALKDDYGEFRSWRKTVREIAIEAILNIREENKIEK